ncbi:putative HD phosphohydrolase family protein [Cavenderia fasciculata]|uniref:HD phosphohydrolase family protein n=1 Tax=Cavenderia fasciculata TaxID=261658 RepID=F4PR90_CACFS|nr:putative HD phosphohydrolase family protein [Cavenderia fasciculata]EGG21290.1 putative HD phosphohydrolase family protein [Cavenderia fasciculata]|eukprot:XP_004359140.1 putative HD phosphohydrolase family protein [Cavenderia fasciculata]
MNTLKSKWIILSKRLNLEDTISNKWYTVLEQYYKPTFSRSYHNANHIDELLGFFDQYQDRLKTPDACLMAIWFHDVIYDATKSDNEDKSVEMFKEFALETKLESKMSDLVSEMIDATKHHTKVQSGINIDQDYFLDFDLSVLGRAPKEYTEYSYNIRREYIHVPEDQYRSGRIAVLKRFISSGRYMYKTKEFQDRFTDNAINNLNQEIDRLSQPLIPLLPEST